MLTHSRIDGLSLQGGENDEMEMEWSTLFYDREFDGTSLVISSAIHASQPA